MTPWCPACKATIPGVQALYRYAESHADLGVQLYVGDDTPEKINAMITNAGVSGVADLSGQASVAIPGRTVPRWAVINAEGEIISRGKRLPAMSTETHPYFQRFVKKAIKP